MMHVKQIKWARSLKHNGKGMYDGVKLFWPSGIFNIMISIHLIDFLTHVLVTERDNKNVGRKSSA